MSTSQRRAIVIGATGMVGKAILDELLQDSNFSEVIAITRRPLERTEPSFKNLVVDFDRLDQHAEQLNADDIFCALGTTIRHAGSKKAFRHVDYEIPLTLAGIAADNGALAFHLVSAVGANANSSVFYLRVKGELESALSKLPYRSVNHFRPAMLEGHREPKRLREEVGVVFSHTISFVLVGPWRKYRAIKATAVAKAMVITALREHAGVRVFESDAIQAIADGRQ